MFSSIVVEKIGWYVYALRDPRDGRVFYVGKGTGNRVFQHAADEIAAGDAEGMSTKLETIRGIRENGQEVDAYIVRHGIPSERQAYDIESAVMDALRLLDADLDNSMFKLTNAVLGWEHGTKGLAHVDVITSVYDAPPAPEIIEPVMLIRIPKLWTPQMPTSELYEATRGWWKVGPRRDGARFALSVSKGVIRAVFRIDRWRAREEGDRGWEEDLGKNPRWGFEGTTTQELGRYLNTSVSHLFRQGEATPIKYVNC